MESGNGAYTSYIKNNGETCTFTSFRTENQVYTREGRKNISLLNLSSISIYFDIHIFLPKQKAKLQFKLPARSATL